MPEHLTLRRARDLLERHGLGTKRSLGQHFLVDPNTVRRIVRMSGVGPGDPVLEVGPGLGSLTVGLLEAGARVVAIELDERVAEALAEVVRGADGVDIVVADALDVDLAAFAPDGARLISNLPYNVATPIVARVLDDAPQVRGGLVMVQRELGERWCAGPGSKVYGAISVKVAYHADARVEGVVPKTVFLPPPKVASVLVSFERRPPPVDVADPPTFFALVEEAFRHRRKTVRNALSAEGRTVPGLAAALAACGVDAHARPEDLGIEAFACLHRTIPGAAS